MPSYASAPENFVGQMIAAQIGFYKFMSHGLDEYKKVLLAIPQTNSPTEVVQMHVCFYTRMGNVCATEAKRLAVPFVAACMKRPMRISLH